MRFQTPLVPATLLKRYKRFLSDIRLADGTEVTAHCPNPGSMLGLKDDDITVWVEPNDDPKKKLKYGWRLVELEGQGFVCIDTSLANRIVAEALQTKKIPQLAAYSAIRPEVKYGENSRIDFLLSGEDLPDAYVEVKSVTLCRDGKTAEFPDSVTARGTKHLGDLTTVKSQGHRAIMLYLVQRSDCSSFQIANDLDPKYAAGFDRARDAGVETLCFETNISPTEITLGQAVEIDKSRQSLA